MEIRSNFREPLQDYPWKADVERLIRWAKPRTGAFHAFIFDLCMSLAYVDSAKSFEQAFEYCPNCPSQFNGHLGFINLCSPCYENAQIWQYQRAAKPNSGVLGKLSSEIILKFIELLLDEIVDTYAIGGSGDADAYLIHEDGTHILAEVKSAPLITYPVLIQFPDDQRPHQAHTFTSSQVREFSSALYLHDQNHIKLGQPNSPGWPFKGVVDYFVNSTEQEYSPFFTSWQKARAAYTTKNKFSPHYYLTNASGMPPNVAKTKFGWPIKTAVSDGKTSAGIDRTDDIKKGIYQTIKLGIKHRDDPTIRTALISNLPAYRHGIDYIMPFNKIIWGSKEDIEIRDGYKVLPAKKTRAIFDYFITLDR